MLVVRNACVWAAGELHGNSGAARSPRNRARLRIHKCNMCSTHALSAMTKRLLTDSPSAAPPPLIPAVVPPATFRELLQQLPNLDEVDQHLLLVNIELFPVPAVARGEEGG